LITFCFHNLANDLHLSETCGCGLGIVVLNIDFFLLMMPHSYYLNLARSFYSLWTYFVFLASQEIEVNQWTNHASSEMDKCEDGHIPTCMLGTKTNLLSHVLPRYSIWKCSPIICLKILVEALLMCSILFCFGGMPKAWKCALNTRGDHWAKIVEQRAIKNRVQYIHCR
jgi:hypothetical protein